MKALNTTTAIVSHLILTMCLTAGFIYGAHQLLVAFPSVDMWLGRYLDWVSVAIIIVGSFFLGRTISFHFVNRCLLPWLRSS